MGRPKGSKNGVRKAKSNPFDSLPQDWRDEIDALGNDEKAVRDRIAKTTLDNAALKEAEENDGDLQEKKAAVKAAMESYSPHYKQHKLMVGYLRQHLDNNGKSTGDSGLDSAVQEFREVMDANDVMLSIKSS
jgi:hypothetical protein